MQAIIRDDLPMLPIFQYARIEGTKDKLIGYTPSVYVSSNCWNIGQWVLGLLSVGRHHSAAGTLPGDGTERLSAASPRAEPVLLLVIVSMIGFAILHLAPGGPLAQFSLTPGMTQADLARIAHQMGLDRPLPRAVLGVGAAHGRRRLGPFLPRQPAGAHDHRRACAAPRWS